METPEIVRRSLKRSCFWGAVLCAALGVVPCFYYNLGSPWIDLSFDLPYLFKSQSPVPDEVVIIHIDEVTYELLHQTPKNFDRKLYAPVLDHLTREGAKQVLIDVWFDPAEATPGDPDLAEAIRRNGNVFLVIEENKRSAEVLATHWRKPAEIFLKAGARAGVSQLEFGDKEVVRQYSNGSNERPGFAWIAAKASGAALGAEPKNDLFLNYYGPPGSLRSVSFSDATRQIPGFYRDRYVLIGSLPSMQYPQEMSDRFRSPHSRWHDKHPYIAGVEVVATAFLNLRRGDGLRRMSLAGELTVLVLSGLILGGGLVWMRPWWAGGVSVLLAGVGTVAGCMAVWNTGVWFAWAFIPLLQVPGALLWAIITQSRRLDREKKHLEVTLTRTLLEVEETRRQHEKSIAAASPPVQRPPAELPPQVADHTLIKRVGKGGYGEVWLARNAVGIHHVIKMVYRRDFSDAGPYEREFRGIQKFMPISRSHLGFVHILHVGRNDEVGFFYYVMEAGDDEVTGQHIVPDQYSPVNLGTRIRKDGAQSARDCLTLGLALSDALGALHAQQLIHRDIKPANIIFANGCAKLADIGLVTDIENTNHDVSRLGTEGYMAPEGPGTPSSDVYSLGKVLYEACMGLDRRRFPELPTALYEADDSMERMQLNRIIIKACEPRQADRYTSAIEMHTDLVALSVEWGVRPS